MPENYAQWCGRSGRLYKSHPDNVPEFPWLGALPIAFFEKLLKPEYRVLEHGCGGSTIWLAQRVKEVVSGAGDDPAWSEGTKKKLAELGLTNATVLDAWPVSPQAWGKFDIVFIDGGPTIFRNKTLRDAFVYYVKPGGWVILDNYNHKVHDDAFAWAKSLSQTTITLKTPKTRFCHTAFMHVPNE